MSRCLLRTGNIMTAGASVIRKPNMEKSNTELVNSLRQSFSAACTPIVAPDAQTTNGDVASPRKPASEWTRTDPESGVIQIPPPCSETESPGLLEERAEYDVTVKLFYLPSLSASSRPEATKEAVALVQQELQTQSLDLVIISMPGISFDADDSSVTSPASAEEVEEWVSTYSTLEEMYDAGTIARLGISEFGTTRLDQLLPRLRVKPGVDQINVRDCCVVPRPLILYAKEQGIELLTHNDCTDILPQETLRQVVMDEFECLGEGAEKELVPLWVVKYTAVVKSRGVVEHKGYIAMAEIR